MHILLMKLSQTEKPTSHRFKHLDRVSKLLEEETEDENSDSVPQVSREEQEIDNYISTKVNKEGMKSDPFNYWLQREINFPNWHELPVKFYPLLHLQLQ